MEAIFREDRIFSPGLSRLAHARASETIHAQRCALPRKEQIMLREVPVLDPNNGHVPVKVGTDTELEHRYF